MTDRRIGAALRAVRDIRARIDRLEATLVEIGDTTGWHKPHVTDMLDTSQAAKTAGLTPSTWQTYVSIGKAPAADEVVSGRPLWRLETVQRWAKSRKVRTR